MFKHKEYIINSPHHKTLLAERINEYLHKGYFATDTFHIAGEFTSDTKFTAVNGSRFWGAAVYIGLFDVKAKCEITDLAGGAVVHIKLALYADWLICALAILFTLYILLAGIHVAFLIIILPFLGIMLFSRFIQRQTLLASLETIILQK